MAHEMVLFQGLANMRDPPHIMYLSSHFKDRRALERNSTNLHVKYIKIPGSVLIY